MVILRRPPVSTFERLASSRVGRRPKTLQCPRCDNGDDQMATEDDTRRVPSKIVFTALICAGYVYVAFGLA
jgi:hypothetical protein